MDEQNPGSDLAGETLAAKEPASIVFREANPLYSHLLASSLCQRELIALSLLTSLKTHIEEIRFVRPIKLSEQRLNECIEGKYRKLGVGFAMTHSYHSRKLFNNLRLGWHSIICGWEKNSLEQHS